MRRASLLRSLTAVLLLVILLWIATTPAGSHGLPCGLLVALWWLAAPGSIRLRRGAARPAAAQPLALAACLSPRAPPAA